MVSRQSSSSSKVCALLELATLRHRNAPPLLRLVCLPRFLSSDGACTPIGLACAPYAVGRCNVPKHHRRRLWGSHTVALHHIFRCGGYSSSGFNSSSEFHPCTAAGIGFPAGEPADKRVVRSFRGFSPLQRFPSRAEPPIPGGFPTHRLCCALRVSHPLDALLPARPPRLVSSRSRSWGSLLEALFLARRRTPSPAPGPSWGSLPAPKSRSAPPGVQHIARSSPTIPGV